MLALLTEPSTWLALLTLTAMEIVLGVVTIVFISVMVSRLPKAKAPINARRVGLAAGAGVFASCCCWS